MLDITINIKRKHKPCVIVRGYGFDSQEHPCFLRLLNRVRLGKALKGP